MPSFRKYIPRGPRDLRARYEPVVHKTLVVVEQPRYRRHIPDHLCPGQACRPFFHILNGIPGHIFRKRIFSCKILLQFRPADRESLHHTPAGQLYQRNPAVKKNPRCGNILDQIKFLHLLTVKSTAPPSQTTTIRSTISGWFKIAEAILVAAAIPMTYKGSSAECAMALQTKSSDASETAGDTASFRKCSAPLNTLSRYWEAPARSSSFKIS